MKRILLPPPETNDPQLLQNYIKQMYDYIVDLSRNIDKDNFNKTFRNEIEKIRTDINDLKRSK